MIDNHNFAKQRFTARFFFVQDACRTRVTPEGVGGWAIVAYWGEKFDKIKWDKEGEDLEKWERMVREHLAQQPFIKEALVEALESNCCRSYNNLEKVPLPTPCLMNLVSPNLSLSLPPQAHSGLVHCRDHRMLAETKPFVPHVRQKYKAWTYCG